jgi:hypothetical protein
VTVSLSGEESNATRSITLVGSVGGVDAIDVTRTLAAAPRVRRRRTALGRTVTTRSEYQADRWPSLGHSRLTGSSV